MYARVPPMDKTKATSYKPSNMKNALAFILSIGGLLLEVQTTKNGDVFLNLVCCSHKGLC